MFTGLVQDVAGVIDVIIRGNSLRLVLATHLPLARFEIGASVACNGVCLTVVEMHSVPATEETLLEFDVGPESLQASCLGSLKKGEAVNLEPALRVGDSVGGHDVLGHIDTCLSVHSFNAWEGGFWKLVLEVPPALRRFLIPKGSIALRGVSLTIADISESPTVPGGALCSVMIVPHTLSHTNLVHCVPQGSLEVEFDRHVKTVATLLEFMVPHLLPQNLMRSL
jgi:riboflavin synthase